VGLPICDLGTGMWGAQGVLAALYERQTTGRGQKIECSLLETAVAFSSWTSAGWLADHVEPVRMGSRHRQNAPYQRFETQDGYMMIGAAAQSIWERCARALGHPEWLEDTRFARSPERRKNRGALEKEISAVLATAPTAHWTKLLDEAGVPCGPVYNYEQLFSDPQVRHREMVVHAEDAELGGRVPHIRTPIRMSASDVAVRRTAPRLGQHTDEVLGRLGYSAAEIAVLRREKVV
jgi:crotonobetainyl-CoA:carnitine CoA-transferase CaiB-like acyl-CoA transferase